MSPSFGHRSALLASLLGVLAGAASCGVEEHERSYVAGEPIGSGLGPVEMPALPCLPKSDPKLSVFNPGCTEDFAVISGPRQGTDAAGKATCSYTVEYDKIYGCEVGRPLTIVGEGARTAALAPNADWSTRG